MKVIEAKYQIKNNISQDMTPEEQLRLIEQIGRICYKSEDKITHTSFYPFIEGIKRKRHTSVLSHGSVYLKFTFFSFFSLAAIIFYIKSLFNPYTVVRWNRIYTNYRVVFEKHKDKIPKSLKHFKPSLEDPHRRFTIVFTCDRGVSHEIVRSTTLCFTQESTRYCVYSSGKFGNQITIIKPEWLTDLKCGIYDYSSVSDLFTNSSLESFCWISSMLDIEATYITLMNVYNWVAQKARSVLPNSLKTEIAVTGSIKQIYLFMNSRVQKDCHPQMRELTVPLLSDLQTVLPKNFKSIVIK